MVHLRQRKEDQNGCHGLGGFFPSCCLLLAMICFWSTRTVAAAAVATARTCDGSAFIHGRSSSLVNEQPIDFLGSLPNHNLNSKVNSRFPRCGAVTSSLSSSIRGRQTASTTASISTSTTMLSIRGGGAVTGGGVGSSAGLFIAGAKAIMASIGESKTKCWILLIVSILAETWATSLSKAARDAKSPRLFAAALLLYSSCMLGFNVALSKIEVGIAYAVWSALGTIVVTYIGIVCFHESFDLYKLLCLSLILAGVIGLNLREDHP